MEYRAGGQEVRGQGDSRQRLVYTGIPPTGNQPGLGWEDKAGNGAGGGVGGGLLPIPGAESGVQDGNWGEGRS